MLILLFAYSSTESERSSLYARHWITFLSGISATDRSIHVCKQLCFYYRSLLSHCTTRYIEDTVIDVARVRVNVNLPEIEERSLLHANCRIFTRGKSIAIEVNKGHSACRVAATNHL